MSAPRRSRLPWIARVGWIWGPLVVLPALFHLGALGVIFASRLRYGFDVEWMEGGALLHAHRLLHGLPIYTEPGKGFMPYPYPPFHAFVLAVFGAVFGVDFTMGRAVSIAAIVVAGGLLAREVHRAFRPVGKPLVWALLAAGLVAAGFPATGGWYDLVRNDSLAVMLPIVAAVLVADGPRTLRAQLAVAVTLTMAVLTKQTNLAFLGWLGLWAVLTQGRRGLRGAALSVGLTGLALVALRLATHDRFWFYTVKMLSTHHVDWARARQGGELVRAFAPYIEVVPLLALALALHRRLSARALLWTGMLAAAVPASILPYAKVGGHINNFTPLVVLCGPVALVLAAEVLRAFRRSASLALAPMVLAGSLDVYLLHRTYRLDEHRVTPARREAARRLTDYLRAKAPSLLVPEHPIPAIRAGAKVEGIHPMPWIDARWAGLPGLDLRPFLQRTNPEWIVLSGAEEDPVLRSVEADYAFVEAVPPNLEPASTITPTSRRLIAACQRRRPLADVRSVFSFEQGDLSGWQRTGQAFEPGITSTSPAKQGRIIFAEGKRLLNSFHPTLHDGARGRATSPPFVLDRARMALLVGGSDDAKTRVELEIDGVVPPGLRASGSRAEMLREVVWDVSRWAGRKARLIVIDESDGAWGHIIVDDVRLFNPAGR